MKLLRVVAVLLVASVALAWIDAGPASAQSAGDPAQELAEKWAPFLQIRTQEEECDRETESWEPTPVDIVLGNPEVVLRDSDGNIVVTGPTAADLFGLGEDYYLDFPGNALSPGCTYERDFRRFKAEQGTVPTIYAHVVTQPGDPDLVFVQYWFYWYFNDWNNTHESDWEGMAVVFEAGSVEEALQQEPVAVGYAQHSGGERADWTDSKVQKNDGRPVVFPSAGSHATYYGNALYLGRSASEGFGCDNTRAPSTMLDPEVILLPDEVTSADDPLAWLAYEGHWGEKHRGAFDGPTGPAAKDRYLDPSDWYDDLRESSVVIPGESTFGPSVTSAFCTVVEAGSTALLWVVATPWLSLGVFIAVIVLIVVAVRRTRWSPVTTAPLVGRRRAGQCLRAAARRYRQLPRTFIVIGLIFVPVALIVALVQTVIFQLPVLRQLADLFGGRSGPISVLVTLLIGGIGNSFALHLVTAAVASAAVNEETGGRGSAARAWAAAVTNARDLFLAVVKVLFFVSALLVSVVGIPWALRNAISWTFVSEEVILNGASHQDALKASRARVQGTWWRTAAFAIVVLGLAVVSGPLVGLPLLLITGWPLLLINLIGSLVFTVVVPYATLAMTYLWGDRLAADSEAEPSPPTPVGRTEA